MNAEKPSNLAHYPNSFRFWLLVVVAAYFALALYWAITEMYWSTGLPSDQYIFHELSKGPLWWMILWYASEGISGTIGCILRAAAGLLALYSAVLFWRKKDSALPLIRGKVSKALLLEACYFLCFIPFTVAAFAYYLSTENLYYFDHTPGSILLYVTGIPTLLMVAVIPPLLFKLRSRITQASPDEEIIKWSCITSVAYIFVVFWLSYSMSAVGNLIPYARSQGQYGLAFFLEPVHLVSFVLTVCGLFLIGVFGLLFTLPAIRKLPVRLSLRRIGGVITAFGGYFLFNTLYFYLTGGYAAHPNVWYEIIGPPHNPNVLWCVTFLFLGLALLASRSSRER
jgi:hypothetical protein